MGLCRLRVLLVTVAARLVESSGHVLRRTRPSRAAPAKAAARACHWPARRLLHGTFIVVIIYETSAQVYTKAVQGLNATVMVTVVGAGGAAGAHTAGT
jgi:hypothetical protein